MHFCVCIRWLLHCKHWQRAATCTEVPPPTTPSHIVFIDQSHQHDVSVATGSCTPLPFDAFFVSPCGGQVWCCVTWRRVWHLMWLVIPFVHLLASQSPWRNCETAQPVPGPAELVLADGVVFMAQPRDLRWDEHHIDYMAFLYYFLHWCFPVNTMTTTTAFYFISYQCHVFHACLLPCCCCCCCCC